MIKIALRNGKSQGLKTAILTLYFKLPEVC